jgi:hypothetical protein
MFLIEYLSRHLKYLQYLPLIVLGGAEIAIGLGIALAIGATLGLGIHIHT